MPIDQQQRHPEQNNDPNNSDNLTSAARTQQSDGTGQNFSSGTRSKTIDENRSNKTNQTDSSDRIDKDD